MDCIGEADPRLNDQPERSSKAPDMPSLTGSPSSRASLAPLETQAGQGVQDGTLSVGAGMSTVPKSAGLTISRYSMSGE